MANSDKGYIKLFRQIEGNIIWESKEPFDRRSAWIDLLMMVNFADSKLIIKNKVVTIRKGQTMTSVIKLSKRWQWSRNRTLRFLRLLAEQHMITYSGTPSGTLLTIVKYGVYQGGDTANGTSNGTTSGTPDGTTDGTQNKKNKKNKEEYKKETSASLLVDEIEEEDEDDEEWEDPDEYLRIQNR